MLSNNDKDVTAPTEPAYSENAIPVLAALGAERGLVELISSLNQGGTPKKYKAGNRGWEKADKSKTKAKSARRRRMHKLSKSARTGNPESLI